MNFKVIEEKWSRFWADNPKIMAADDESTKPKKYILVEFPYPSGSGLHMGHTFSFTGGDVYARFKRMQGNNVLFPMGWDAFGLPTENYAIKMKRKPQEVTGENTTMFRNQMKRLAFSFDWDREIDTTDPKYYKWTQWIFVKLFEKGLAYKKEMPINWCPSCKIGLANEEVVDGKCERCGAEVSRRNISQWVVKITDYADRLAEGLKSTDFVEKVKAAQINWIGKTSGINIDYPIEGSEELISCYSTRPDTNFGATFVVMAPEHPRVMELTTAENREVVQKYVEDSRRKSELERTDLQKEKTGVFTGTYCINRLTNKRMPIWVSDFVVLTAGTGVVVGVPAHDERDFDFAKKHGMECVPVIVPKNGKKWDFEKAPFLDIDDAVVTNSDFLNGMLALEAKEKIIDYLEERGWGKRASNYHLRDWIFSRQHYWGEPIPMINCPRCGWVPVKEEDLPVKLPEVEAYEPTDDGQSPLAKMEDFVNCKCPKCGGAAKRETDTMPNWAGSDWYFLRYIDPHNDVFLASQEKLNKWLPVDVYIGGDEHNTLHLLYSRFIYQFLWDLGVLPKDYPEPYFKRLSHGVILGPNNQRMSKSHGNVIVPDEMADKYGVDVVRSYLMFMGPFTGTMSWSENTLMGVKRFLDKLNNLILSQSDSLNDSNEDVQVTINNLIDGVTRDINEYGFNTAIAKMMGAVNKIINEKMPVTVENKKVLVKLMAPFAPYSTEEWWRSLGGEGSVHVADWPKVNQRYLVKEKVIVPVAINGKVRGQLTVEKASLNDQEKVVEEAKEVVRARLEGKLVAKEIYVPGRMVNLVIK